MIIPGGNQNKECIRNIKTISGLPLCKTDNDKLSTQKSIIKP